ncbi:MAG: deoxyribodipyrimidine photo-lyase [Betaproteobacteria bacterium]|nr:MAG: deoxyribodipyrimidine photo-lyase [Betaproteobacteria bacterium]
MKLYDRALVWFRRDLRTDDNAALSRALDEAGAVYCVFVFDTEILDALPGKCDRRVEFIWHSLVELKSTLRALGGDLHVLHGRARDEVPAFVVKHRIQAVYANHDYEPVAVDRDRDVAARLEALPCSWHTCKDQVIFEKSEILNAEQRPYVVFTPYKKAWLAKLGQCDTDPYPVAERAGSLAAADAGPMPELESIGFKRTNLLRLGIAVGATGADSLFGDFLGRIGGYAQCRDFPAMAGPSRLSVHLRFGTISIRRLVGSAMELDADADTRDGASTWLSELIWREFYFSILHHFPHVVDGAFRREYDDLEFENNESHFRRWCNAETGYPLIDAAMRQINCTGYMHNRLRMVSASFLVKDLQIDWRWGERYFAQHLNDFDLSANNGGWQWCASTGCDAQPYFRIFNPVTQSKKFDPEGVFIRSQLPELSDVPDKYLHEPWKMPPEVQRASGCLLGQTYPGPIVDHAAARKKTLAIYSAVRDLKA